MSQYLNYEFSEYLRKPTILYNEDDTSVSRMLKKFISDYSYPSIGYRKYEIYQMMSCNLIIAVLHEDTIKISKFFQRVIKENNETYHREYKYQYTGVSSDEELYKPLSDKLDKVSKPFRERVKSRVRDECERMTENE